jgi:hypothetical protein
MTQEATLDAVAAVSPARSSGARRRAALGVVTFAIVLGLGGLVRLRDDMFARAPQVDLRAYLHAFDLVSAGKDPYVEGAFLYPPPFAVVGAALYRGLGEVAFLAVFRWACLAGVWLLVWVALDATRWPLPAAAIAAVAATWSPLLENSFGCGNVSPLIIGLLVVSLAWAARAPAGAGLAIGTLDAFKPMGVSAVLVRATPERGRSSLATSVRLLVGAGAASVAWLWVGHRFLGSWLGRSQGFPERIINVSLHRALWALGMHVSAVVPFAVVTALGMLVAWRWARSSRERVALAATTSLLTLPVASPGSFLLTLPAQALALEAAHGRWRAAPGGSVARRNALGELAVVAAAVVSVHGAEGAVATGELPVIVQVAVTLIPLGAAAALTVYPLWRRAPA